MAIEPEELYDETRALIALSMIPGVGPGRIRALVAECGSARAVFDASRRRLATIPGIGPQTRDAIAAFEDFAAVTRQIQLAERAGAELVPYWDERFPRLLETIFDPPAYLWVRGRLEPGEDRTVAVVGTRRPSAYGERVTANLVAALVERGFTIVSGLAYGIDAVAHREALRVGGRTLAVLGSGVDRIYPARHATMARGIIAHGALLSEFPLQAPPDAVNFPRRNRIISGLAHGTLVVEAYEQGGALITAHLALEQNREVFAVPGSIYNGAAAGCHRLIQSGEAKLVASVDDILTELGVFAADMPAGANGEDVLSTLDPVERALYEVLTDTPMPIDSICAKAELDASTALVYLLNLEFRGVVQQLAGKQFYRVTNG